MATQDYDRVLRGRRVITPDGEVPRCVAVRDGVVVAVEPHEAGLRATTTVERADDEVLLPGLVDTHVHVNEPGRTEWEGYATATRPAAACGVTTLIDMPGLSAVWTEARLRGHTLVDVVGWMAEQPARIAALRHKGRIAPGCHADFAVFAPDDAFVVDPKRLLHRNPVTPYAQRALAGVVRSTWLRGRRILAGGAACGQLISRGEA